MGGKSADRKFVGKKIDFVIMSGLTDGAVVREFRELGIEVKPGSSVLDRRELRAHQLGIIWNLISSLLPPTSPSLPSVQEIGHQYHLDANQLCDEWVAYSAQNNDCELAEENIEKWENTLHVKSRQTPTSRKAVSKIRGRGDAGTMYTQDDLDDM